MASKRDEFETKVLNTEKEAAKYIRRGWEIVSSTSSGTWVTGKRTKVIVRRANPKYKP